MSRSVESLDEMTAVKLGLLILSILLPVYTQTSKTALVLLDDLSIKETHSRYFRNLRGNNPDIKLKIRLKQFDF